MREVTERSKLSKWLRRCNAIVIPQVPTKYSAVGVPDLLVIHRKFFGFVETKAKGNKLSGAQQDMFMLCVKRNFPIAIVTFLEDGTYEVVLGAKGSITNFNCTMKKFLPMVTTYLKGEDHA